MIYINTLVKSQKLYSICFHSLRVVKIWFVNVKTAFLIVLPFLKQNWSGIKALFTRKWWFGLLT